MDVVMIILFVVAATAGLFLIIFSPTTIANIYSAKKRKKFKSEHPELIKNLRSYFSLLHNRNEILKSSGYEAIEKTISNIRQKLPYATNSERNEYSLKIDSLTKQRDSMYSTICITLDNEINSLRRNINKTIDLMSIQDKNYVYNELWSADAVETED